MVATHTGASVAEGVCIVKPSGVHLDLCFRDAGERAYGFMLARALCVRVSVRAWKRRSLAHTPRLYE